MFYQYRVAKGEKVNMVAAHLDGVADAWFQNWSQGRVEWSWPKFVNDPCNRFGKKTRTDVIKGFNKLKHKGMVEEY